MSEQSNILTGNSGFWLRLGAARSGSDEELGRLLESYRRYLALIATQSLNDDLRSKSGASDLVQETFLKAKRAFEQFRGNTEAEWKAWLTRILETTKANFERQFFDTQQRRVAREFLTGDSHLAAQASDGLSAPIMSPSSHCRHDEDLERLQRALAKLPERSRKAIEYRQMLKLDFQAIGERLHCSADAARKIWARALVMLQKELKGEP